MLRLVPTKSCVPILSTRSKMKDLLSAGLRIPKRVNRASERGCHV